MALVFIELFIGNDTDFVSNDLGFINHIAVAVTSINCTGHLDDSILLQTIAKLLV